MIGPPSARQQLRFLDQIQRLLSEGSFVASYKFALLHALADLSLVHGDESGAPLTLTTRSIAEQMVELYWRQAMPFPAAAQPAVLRQNTGGQAAMLRKIGEVQAEHGQSLAVVRRSGAWSDLVRDAERRLKVMPLWKLQTVANERLSFLYENEEDPAARSITLQPGVAFCFRAFYPLLVDLIRGGWLRYVRSVNGDLLGDSVDLDAFLFGTPRGSLGAFLPILTELQAGECFYCATSLRGRGEVDHFVPWTRYPVDLGHNFVLAHRNCNAAKRDHLAAEPHLERWLLRNEAHGALLRSEFDRSRLVHDERTTVRVAAWAYAQTARVGAAVWVAGDSFVRLGDEWSRLLDAGPERAMGRAPVRSR